MKLAAIFIAVLIFTGTVSARMPDFYSKLDLPPYAMAKPAYRSGKINPLYIGSDKSYAAESREVQIAGRSLALGFALAGLIQPLGPVFAAGFLLVSIINAKELYGALASKPSKPSQWDFIWSWKN